MSFIGQGLTGLVSYPDITALVTGAGFTAGTDFYTLDGSDVGNTGLWRLKGSKVTAGDSFQVTGTSAEYISTLTITNDGHGSATGPSIVIDGVATPILAVPNVGYSFSQWLGVTGTVSFGSPTGASSTATVTGGDATVESTFSNNTYSLTVTSDGNGSVTPSGTQSVLSYVSTPISADPGADYVFDHWSAAGDAQIASSTSVSTTVILTDSNDTVTANFKFSAERTGPSFNNRAWDRSKPDFFQANPYAGQISKMSTNPRDGERLAEQQQYQD